MNRLLLGIFLLFTASICQAQTQGYLFVKHGYHKKKTYTEGERIMLQLNNGLVVNGIITLLLNDTIYVNGRPIPRTAVSAVLLNTKRNRFPADVKTMLLITAGAALTVVGLTINDRTSFRTAALSAAAIGYGPLVIKYLGKGFLLSLQRRRYRIGKKYRLQILEFHMPLKRAF